MLMNTLDNPLAYPAAPSGWMLQQMLGCLDTSGGPFPPTPALSIRERVNLSPSVGQPSTANWQGRGRGRTLSHGLGITHISRLQEVNPKGIPSLSPGLRAASYPGCEASTDSPTLKGLQHPTRGTEARLEPAPRYNPFRVEHASGTQPRVARGSQPWAGGCNPVGIEERRPDLWGKISSWGKGRREGERRPVTLTALV